MAKEKEYPASNLEFLTAHYVNEARSLVCVKWWNHEDETQYQEFTAPRIGEPIFDRLLTHIDLEDLMDLTYKFREESKLAFESVAVDIAKKEGLIWDINDADATHMMKAFAELMFNRDHNQDPDIKEKIFIFKLQLFEFPEVKKSKNKSLKSKIRKATNIIDVVRLSCDLYDDIYSTSPAASSTDTSD